MRSSWGRSPRSARPSRQACSPSATGAGCSRSTCRIGILTADHRVLFAAGSDRAARKLNWSGAASTRGCVWAADHRSAGLRAQRGNRRFAILQIVGGCLVFALLVRTRAAASGAADPVRSVAHSAVRAVDRVVGVFLHGADGGTRGTCLSRFSDWDRSAVETGLLDDAVAHCRGVRSADRRTSRRSLSRRNSRWHRSADECRSASC